MSLNRLVSSVTAMKWNRHKDRAWLLEWVVRDARQGA